MVGCWLSWKGGMADSRLENEAEKIREYPECMLV